jgi:hypothetical protein
VPKEIFPSSFECDCGHQSDFFENTVKEMKAMSQKKKVYLADSAPEEHTIVFYRGKLVEIQCPKQAQSHETKPSAPKSRPGKKRATTRGTHSIGFSGRPMALEGASNSHRDSLLLHDR